MSYKDNLDDDIWNIVFGLSALFLAVVWPAAAIPVGTHSDKAQAGGGLQNGLVAYYPFYGNANDFSGNGLHGTVNGATLTTDRFGYPDRAYSFNGVSNYISIGSPVPAPLRIQNAISYSVWIKLAAYPKPVVSSVVGCQYDGSSSGAAIHVLTLTSSDGQTLPANHIQMTMGVGSGWQSDNAKAGLPLNAWTHIVATRALNRQAVFYMNGELLASAGTPSPMWTSPINYDVNSMYVIGKQTGMSDRFFNGGIDDVRIYNRVLTAAEARLLYTEGNYGFVSFYFFCDEVIAKPIPELELP